MNIPKTFASYFSQEHFYQEIIDTLAQKMQEGNVCLAMSDTQQSHLSKLSERRNSQYHFSSLFNTDTTDAQSPKSVQPFVYHKSKVYTQRFFSYESKLLSGIKELIAMERTHHDVTAVTSHDIKLLVNELFKESYDGTTNWQMVACLIALRRRFFILTGGPGTGKTTTISKFLEISLAIDSDISIKIAAPTGKAASRLKDSLAAPYGDTSIIKNEKISQLEPTTIHQLLRIHPQTNKARKNKDNTIDCDILIIDESSMIDITIFTLLIEAVDKHRTRVVLLGDPNQLPSVGAGSLFGDLCDAIQNTDTFTSSEVYYLSSMGVDMTEIKLSASNHQHPLAQHIIALKKTYRNSGAIKDISDAVIQGNHTSFHRILRQVPTNVTFVDINDDNAVQELLHQYIHELTLTFQQSKDIDDALSKLNQRKILCATKAGRYGVHQIHQLFHRNLNTNNDAYYQHQLIMVTKNQYDINLSNGDIGIIHRNDDKHYRAYFPIYNTDSRVPLSVIPTNIQEWTDAYALTIHKSQGSEYDQVIIIIPEETSQEHNFLTREILYTGITRAKKSVIIISSLASLDKLIAAKVQRISGINDRWEE